MITFLNLFLVPLITLRIRHRRTGEALSFSMATLAEYGTVAVMLLILTKVPCFLLNYFFYLGLGEASPFYTVIAAAIAMLLPYAREFLQKRVSASCTVTPLEETDEVETHA